MRIVEDRHPGESWLLWKLGNLTTIDSDRVRSVGIAWLFKENGKWRVIPRITGNVALFYNAVFFLRLNWPLGIFWMIRWAEVGPVIWKKARAYWQAGLGWKLNGRFSLTFRIQGDESAAAGVTGANVGQSTCFEYGAH